MTSRTSFSVRDLLPGVAAMTVVVVASNILVLYPVQMTIGALNLADLLTWGAFTYPAAFFVTDMTNRRYGPTIARLVVVAGFAVAVALSVYLSTPRIAIASGSAFLVGQLLDVTVFNRLRRSSWWRAPLAASIFGSMLDTVLFFSLAFSASAGALGPNDAFAIESAPFLGLFAAEFPRWVSWAAGDFSVKMLAALAFLLPYRALLGVVGAWTPVPRRG